jgi:hypothetical protein
MPEERKLVTVLFAPEGMIERLDDRQFLRRLDEVAVNLG